MNRRGDLGRRKASNQKEVAKVEVIGHIRQGLSPTEAMDQVNRSVKTFYQWTYESTKFAEAVKGAQEAFNLQQAKASQPYRARMDEFTPVKLADFKTWTEYVVAFRKSYFGFDTFDHQWKILQAWEASPPGGISLVLVAPESGKSTLLLDTVIADLCDDPNRRIALLSEGQDLARKMLSRVQRRLTYDGGEVPPLIEHFGPFKPATQANKRWNADEMTILASDHDEQDPSVLSVGIQGAIRGLRWDRVFLDDIQSIRNLNATPKIVEIIRGDVVTRPGRLGKLIITGSRVGKTDVYGELERLELIDELVCIPALDLSRPKGSQSYFPRQVDELGVPITDAKGDQMGWSDEDLAQRRSKVGEDQWSRVYMQQPQSEFSAMINEGDIANATDKDRLVGMAPSKSVGTMAGLDPSLMGYAAFTYCGYDAEHLYVMDLTNMYRPTTNQKLFGELKRGTLRYRPEWWVIENNTLQQGYLTDDAFLELKGELGFNAIGHHTGDNKRDQQLGIPAMLNAIVRGEIRFPVITASDAAFATLFDQLMSWREDVPTRRLIQDQVMSLWFCYLQWRKLRGLVGQDLSTWQRDGLSSVTLYPHARTNLQGQSTEETTRTPMTYEQVWDSLARPA